MLFSTPMTTMVTIFAKFLLTRKKQIDIMTRATNRMLQTLLVYRSRLNHGYSILHLAFRIIVFLTYGHYGCTQDSIVFKNFYPWVCIKFLVLPFLTGADITSHSPIWPMGAYAVQWTFDHQITVSLERILG